MFTGILISLYSIPCILLMLSTGTILACLSKNTVEVSFWGTPVIIFFISLEIINRFLSNQDAALLRKLLPNHVFAEGLELIAVQPARAFAYPFLYFILLAGVFVLLALFMLDKRKHTF
ncbi:hypothetical protein [Paenibacillus sp. 1P07SE]|uniref:hypothetical protein n=1 Tax=Paenibacillus sp. 1P07SE TaxID=3132209 RepID=UPI0039A62BE7